MVIYKKGENCERMFYKGNARDGYNHIKYLLKLNKCSLVYTVSLSKTGVLYSLHLQNRFDCWRPVQII